MILGNKLLGGKRNQIISDYSWSISGSTVTINISGSKGTAFSLVPNSNITLATTNGVIGATGTYSTTGTFSRPDCSNTTLALQVTLNVPPEVVISATATTLSTSVAGYGIGESILIADRSASVNKTTNVATLNIGSFPAKVQQVLVQCLAGGGSGLTFSNSDFYVTSPGSYQVDITPGPLSKSNRYQGSFRITPTRNSTWDACDTGAGTWANFH